EFRTLLDDLPTAARARYLAGAIESVDDDRVRFVLSNEAQRVRCEKFRAEVEAAVSTHIGVAMSLELSVGGGAESAGSTEPTRVPEADDEVDLGELSDAATTSDTVVERISDVFPGAEMLTTPES
ncbi:MAG: hypothetical protein HKO87_02700, partial [Acidimicrobiia bacterium]|nr:hypothetical protein [Acidimicrobiia bacterium]